VNRRADHLLILLGSVLLALSRLPLHLGWLVFLGWIPFLYVFERGVERVSRLWRMSFILAAVYVLVVMYWIGEVTLPGLIGIELFYVVEYFLVFYAVRRIFAVLPRWRYHGFVALLILFEYVQNFGETRFPWFNHAYSLADFTVLIQAADLGGVILLSALILAVNVLLFRLVFKKGRLPALIALAALFTLWIGYGLYCLRSKPLERHDAKVYVMQPSIRQNLKWDEAYYLEILQRYKKLTLQAGRDGARLVIWPEAAMPVYLMLYPQHQMELRAIMDSAGVDVFTGFPHAEIAPPEHVNNELFYNAASLFGRDRMYNDLYYKNILVPVGERMLWLKQFPFLWKLQFDQANWEFGTELRYYEKDGYVFSPSICYELAFEGIHHRMAIPRDSTGFHKSDYLVNITNDAWFGTSYGPWLHSVMARFRAVENRIQIYRSANTGISMIVDPMGRVLDRAGLFQIRNLTAPLYISPEIPLARRIGRWPLAIVAFALLLTLVSCFKTMPRRS
jgi:apolipoprotein N-acyltransferase